MTSRSNTSAGTILTLQKLYDQLVLNGQKFIDNKNEQNTQNYVDTVESIDILISNINQQQSGTIKFSDTLVSGVNKFSCGKVV